MLESWCSPWLYYVVLHLVAWIVRAFLSHATSWSSSTMRDNLHAPSKMNVDFQFWTIFCSQRFFLLGRNWVFRSKCSVSFHSLSGWERSMEGQALRKKLCYTSSNSIVLVGTLQMVWCNKVLGTVYQVYINPILQMGSSSQCPTTLKLGHCTTLKIVTGPTTLKRDPSPYACIAPKQTGP